MVRQTETQSEDYKACIMAWSAPTISEYEAQQKCFTMLPTVEQLDSILRTTKASLYLKHGCFDTDSRVLLEVDRDSN